MAQTFPARHQYYRHPESGIAYFATRTGPLDMDITRQETPGDVPERIAAIGFDTFYNPDGPWYVVPVDGIRLNQVHMRRFHHPETAAMAIAKEDAEITYSDILNQKQLPAMRAEGEADMDRFFTADPVPTELPAPAD